MIGKGNTSTSIEEILTQVDETQIVAYYLHLTEIPCLICSPLRSDKHPSFGIYTPDGKEVNYIDFSTREGGRPFNLLSQLWQISVPGVISRVLKDLEHIKRHSVSINTSIVNSTGNNKSNAPKSNLSSDTLLQCKIRDWRKHDIEYWKSYGITIEWLKFAEVYPISHKIVIKNGKQYVFGADKYAYAYVEHKEGKVTLKIYQPFNRFGYKWSSNIDRSVWSLWTKIPEYGDNLIISSSVKDCLNIMCNFKIPSICLQGEGYLPKPRIMEELKSRYKNIIIFFDNDFTNPDNPGHNDAVKLCKEYNLKMIEIPKEYKSKDPSDLFKKYGRDKYLEIMNEILKDVLWKNGDQ